MPSGGGGTVAVGAAGTQLRQTAAQAAEVHTRRLTDEGEVAVLAKQIMFGFTLEPPWPGNPILNGAYDHRLPEAGLGQSLRLVRHHRTHPRHCTPQPGNGTRQWGYRCNNRAILQSCRDFS